MNARWRLYYLVVAVLGPFFGANVSLAGVDQVRIQLETTDTDGNPISTVGLGDDFFVRTFVQDQRDSSASGVFAAYMDVNYPTSLVSLTADITYAAPYTNGRMGNTSVVGLVDEVGAFGGFSPTGRDKHLFFTLAFSANAVGDAVFASDPADSLVGTDVLLYGLNTIVPPELVDYGNTTLSIVPEECAVNEGTNPADLNCRCALGQEEIGIPGDIDGNGTVAFSDFLVLSTNFGLSHASYSMGDLDCNGSVGFADFLVLAENFGKTTSDVATVPEPNGFILVWLGVLWLATFRRHRRQ